MSVLLSIHRPQYSLKLASWDVCSDVFGISSIVETLWIPLRQLLIRVFGVFGKKGSTEFGLQRLRLEGGGDVILVLLLLFHRDVC